MTWVADLVLLLHGVVAIFLVGGLVLIVAGGLRRWRWVRNPWFRAAHLALMVLVAAQAWCGRLCPLTTIEMNLRERAGDAVYAGSFVAHWLQRLLYYSAPAWVFTLAYTLFVAAVAAAWWWVRPAPCCSRRAATPGS